jgi:hypothetical protein
VHVHFHVHIHVDVHAWRNCWLKLFLKRGSFDFVVVCSLQSELIVLMLVR